ncbi:hypothetical protein HJC23_011524 [Cyclotella cryptica]|uniref:Uncharacterized protein n=1 Tax=Cyclotella cryptica TaxID=29204 RepID=A0ABD3PUG3_9STRA
MAGAINPDERRRSTRSSTASSRHSQSLKSELSSSSTKPPKRKDSHSTPFDEKGRCHRHKGVQMATKKMSGGWKILNQVCPKCIEDNYVNHDDGIIETHSLRSGKSAVSSSGKSKEYREKYDQDYSTLSSLARKLEKPYDANGCCVVHAHIQIAKKKVLGGWKVLRSCPACEGGEDIGLDDDRLSVASGKSGKSGKSNRSTKSGRDGNGRASHNPTQSGRYGALPFDGEGYCCRHPSIRIAKKKTMGGWKILFDICPDCEEEGAGEKSGGAARRNRSVSRSRQGSSSVKSRGRPSGEEGETQSITSGRSGKNSSTEKGVVKKVKNLKIRDDSQCPGRYTGYVDEDYRPNGRGVITYENGMEWEGIWSGGSQVHGRTKGHKSKF